MNQFRNWLVVLLGWSIGSTLVSAQQTAVVSEINGTKVYLTIDPRQLSANLDTLFNQIVQVQDASNELSWADILANGTNPGVDVNFFGYDATGLGAVTTAGTFTGDSLVLNKDASIAGRLQVNGAVGMGDSLEVEGMVILNDSLRVVKSTVIGETLQVVGVTHLGDSLVVEGNVSLDQILEVAGHAYFQSTLEVTGSSTLNDTLEVNALTMLNDSLHVTGATDIDGNLNVDGSTTVDGLTADGDFDLNGNGDVSGTLAVDGVTSLSDSLHVTGGTDIDSNLNVDGSTTVEGLTADGDFDLNGNGDVSGTLSVDGVTSLNDSLHVTGGTDIDGNLNVDGSTTVDGLTADGDFDLNGNGDISGTLSVDGVTSLNDSLHVTGGTDIDSNLNVDGSTTVDALTADGDFDLNGNGDVSGTLSVDGVTSLNDSLHVTGGTDMDGNLNVDGSTTVDGLTADGDFDLNGNGDISGTLSVDGVTSLNDSLHVTGGTDMDGNLNVDGSTTVDGLTADGDFDLNGNGDISGTLSVDGVTSLNDSLHVTGGTDIDGNLNVDGSTTIDALTAYGDFDLNGNGDVSGTLSVDGVTSLNDSLHVAGNTHLASDLQVDGNTNIGGTLNVTGVTSFADSVHIGGNAAIAGTLEVAELLVNGGNFMAFENTDALPQGDTNLYFTADQEALLMATFNLLNSLLDELFDPAVILTQDAQNILANTADLTATFDAGGAEVDSAGFVLYSAADPSDSTVYPVTPSGASLAQNLPGLQKGTAYSYRAFIGTLLGLKHGALENFTTLDDASVSTLVPTDVQTDGLTLQGQLDGTGGGTISATGFRYSLNADLSDSTIVVGDTLAGTFVATLNGIDQNTTVYYQAFATNELGTVYGTTQSDTTLIGPCNLITTETYNGYTYDLVEIGNQCWFQENLRTTQYADGYSIPYVNNNSQWENTTYGAQCIYGNNGSYESGYGRLYNRYAVQNSRGLCPVGWHVPSDEDFMQLELSIGMDSSEVNSIGWRGTMGFDLKASPANNPSWNGSNSSGFTAVPTGFRTNFIESFAFIGTRAFFWTSTGSIDDPVLIRGLYSTDSGVYRGGNNSPWQGHGVRCLKDD